MRRNKVIKQALRRRYAVTLKHNESTFSGVLYDFDHISYVFTQCMTVPAVPGETPEPLSSPVIVDRAAVAYLQELAS
jgi:small nuclear ribonucleoprotein (snRNP)-like protein